METTQKPITAVAIRIARTEEFNGFRWQAGRYELVDADLGFGVGEHFRSALVDAMVLRPGNASVIVKVPVFFDASELAGGSVTVTCEHIGGEMVKLTAFVIEAVEEI